MKDWLIRALKTFAQAFFGVLIPELVTLLNGGFTDWSTAWKILSPFVAAALAAGISAVWNIILEKAKTISDTAAAAQAVTEPKPDAAASTANVSDTEIASTTATEDTATDAAAASTSTEAVSDTVSDAGAAAQAATASKTGAAAEASSTSGTSSTGV